MLQLSQIKLLQDAIFVEEHPVLVKETVNGITRDPNEVKRERETRLYRTGVVILQGEFSQKVIEEVGKDLIGKTVIYTANMAEVVDLPIVGVARLISLQAFYINGFIEDAKDDEDTRTT
jgi:hypothetical protein